MKRTTAAKAPGSTGRASADTRVMDRTQGEDVLVETDSKQLATLTGIDDADYFIQEEFFLRAGTSIADTVPSYKLASLLKSDSATVQKAFRGQEPYIVLCAHMSEIANINRAVAMLTENLRAVGKISLVLLEGVCDNPDVFLNRALTVKESVTVNPAMLQLADRPLITKKQQYSVWVIHTTTASRLTRAQPKFRQIRMFAPGDEPNVIVFKVPKEEEKMMVLQYHVQWEQELFDSLSIQKTEAVLVPGADPGQSRYLFCQLSLDHAHELVRLYGNRARFGIMPLKWYQGDAVDDLPRRFEVYIGAEVREKHAPFMFAYLLSLFWELRPNGLLAAQSGVAIQVVGYNKVRLGPSDAAHNVLVEQLDKCSSQYGLKFKDEGSGEFVGQGDTYIQPPAEWGPADNLFLINVPPWWGEKAIVAIMQTSEVEKLIVRRMRWSVGEIRTLTWKVCVPQAETPKILGSVFRGSEGDFLMQVISQPEYAMRRERGNPKGGGKGRGKGGAGSSSAPVSSSRSYSSVASSGASTSVASSAAMECDVDLKFNKRKR